MLPPDHPLRRAAEERERETSQTRSRKPAKWASHTHFKSELSNLN